MSAHIRDCSSCPHSIANGGRPGTRFSETPCARCKPWEPSNETVVQSKPYREERLEENQQPEDE